MPLLYRVVTPPMKNRAKKEIIKPKIKKPIINIYKVVTNTINYIKVWKSTYCCASSNSALFKDM